MSISPPTETHTHQELPFAISFENNEMAVFQRKCSICFDARYDFYFDHCRDQFCKDCFNRYIDEVTKTCWGVNIPIIKCPVCCEELEKDEWAKYCQPEFVSRYEKAVLPFKPLIRTCPNCDHQVEAVSHLYKNTNKVQLADNIWQLLVQILGPGEAEFTERIHAQLKFNQNTVEPCIKQIYKVNQQLICSWYRKN